MYEYWFQVIPTSTTMLTSFLTYHREKVMAYLYTDIPSDSVSGIYYLTFYLTFYLASILTFYLTALQRVSTAHCLLRSREERSGAQFAGRRRNGEVSLIGRDPDQLGKKQLFFNSGNAGDACLKIPSHIHRQHIILH